MYCNRLQRTFFVTLPVSLCLFGLSFSGASAKESYGESSLGRQLLHQYLSAAFPDRPKLVKPSLVPSISFYCTNTNCLKTIDEIKTFIPNGIEQSIVSRRGTEAIFEVSFFGSDSERLSESRDYALRPDEKVSTVIEAGCLVAGFHIDTTVTKVLVEVVETGSKRNDAGCVAIQLARGSGMAFKESGNGKPWDLDRLSQSKYLAFKTTINHFFKLHWLGQTVPGMDELTVRNILARSPMD